MKTCRNCGTPFEGRSNKLYCSDSCKKQTERDKAKLRELLLRHVEHEKAERDALSLSLYELVRYYRARKARDSLEISLLGYKLKITKEPVRFIEWLMRKRPRSFAEQAALENYNRNRPRTYTPS